MNRKQYNLNCCKTIYSWEEVFKIIENVKIRSVLGIRTIALSAYLNK